MNEPPISDEKAYREFVEKNADLGYFYGYAMALCGNRHLAYDLLQITHMNIWRKKVWKIWEDKPDTPQTVYRAYVAMMLRNAHLDYAKAPSQKIKEVELTGIREDDFPDEYQMENEVIFKETAKIVWDAVSKLDPTLQDLIHLIYVEQYQLARAARCIGLADSTARRYHKEALRQLEKLLEGQEIEEGGDGR
uniref:RNA polymerase sigma factor n=1 Tax=Streptosporangium sp. CA-256172 TaxID=3240076 RepID=UPI003F4978C5